MCCADHGVHRYGSIVLVRKVFFIITGIFLLVLFAFALLALMRSGGGGPIVRLETHISLSGKADSDGDGVPNWLEEITGSDSLNSSSFPYDKNAVSAKKNIADGLLYGGPGDFTEEIVRRFLFDIGGPASVTNAESERFINESSKYFLQKVEERGLPEIDVYVDDTASREDTLSRFVSALGQFSDADEPFEVLIFDAFAQKNLEDARRVRDSCERALETLPRGVPQGVYDSYYPVFKRVAYLCEALFVTLSSNSADSYLYALKLVHTVTPLDDLTGNFSNFE